MYARRLRHLPYRIKEAPQVLSRFALVLLHITPWEAALRADIVWLGCSPDGRLHDLLGPSHQPTSKDALRRWTVFATTYPAAWKRLITVAVTTLCTDAAMQALPLPPHPRRAYTFEASTTRAVSLVPH